MALDFQEYAQKKSFTTETFPGAAFGLSMISVFKFFLKALIIMFVLWKVTEFGAVSLLSEYEGGSFAIELLGNRYFDNAPLLVANVLNVVANISRLLTVLSVAGIVFSIVGYIVALFVRWQNYERDVITSDLRALKLKKSILDTLAVKRHIRDIWDKFHRQQRSSGAKASEGMSFEDESKLNALNALKNMKVYVNTRQSLDDEQVEQRFRVIIRTPFVQQESDALQNLLKGFDQVATRMEQGQVSFGSQIISADQKQIEYTDAVIVPDKYAFEVIDEDGLVSYGSSDYTFPLDLFVDRQAEIDKKTQQANRWAFRTANELDDLLTTLELGPQRNRVTCGAVNVQFDYRLSFRLDHNKSQQLPETLDKRYNTSGTTVDAHGDSISITLAIPEDLKRPINVPTLYREAFG